MAFPNDLSDVVVFKIHPAIGVARVANNEDYYVFGSDPGSYKSNDRMKRQAVQFRIFAYGENHVGLGELTASVMQTLGISAVWSANVANRKVAFYNGVPLSNNNFVMTAAASSNDPTGGVLTSSQPTFAEGAEIPLGQITADGLFIPPKGGVFRKVAGTPIEPYPAVSQVLADTSSDGSISVRLTLGSRALDVLPACIVVAPQDFSPDTNESYTLYDYLRDNLSIPTTPGPGTIHNETAQRIDRGALLSGTSDFNPGFEVSLGGRGEVTDLATLFYRNVDDPRIDPREIRVRYQVATGGSGAVLGQLTSGLCSTWQGDFTACTGYWNEHLPVEVYLDEDENVSVNLFRKQYADTSMGGPRLMSGDDYDLHVDEIGVARLRNAKKVETERDPGDDIV